MDDATQATGGCLCGRTRYAITKPPRHVSHCHCSMCRRANGAVAVTWVSLDADGFTFTSGQPTVYQSSCDAKRTFCASCGSQLTFWSKCKPDEIDVSLGTLDEPER